MKYYVVLLVLLSLALQAQEYNLVPLRTFASSSVGMVKVFHDGNDFFVAKNNSLFKVAPYNLDPILRRLKSAHLEYFKNNGYIIVGYLGGNEYKLRSFMGCSDALPAIGKYTNL